MANGVLTSESVPEAVSGIMGLTDSHLVREVIEMSNREGLMVHGFRKPKFEKVRTSGVLPLTPEGGYVSYWNTGHRIFGVPYPDHFETFDSTVFNYAHSQEGGTKYANVAVARHRDLERAGISTNGFHFNDYVLVRDPVPAELLHLVHFEIEDPRNDREQQQEIEVELLQRLHDVMTFFRPGTLQREQVYRPRVYHRGR
jgi:hypothetical protein